MGNKSKSIRKNKTDTDELIVNFLGRDMGQEEEVIIVFRFIWQIASPTVSGLFYFFFRSMVPR